MISAQGCDADRKLISATFSSIGFVLSLLSSSAPVQLRHVRTAIVIWISTVTVLVAMVQFPLDLIDDGPQDPLVLV